MKVWLQDEKYRCDVAMDADPIEGEDFCDECGSCLVCQLEDECHGNYPHLWVVFASERDTFLEDHPEARPWQ